MIKISAILAALGLAMVLVSMLPGRAPVAISDAAYGMALFSAKGCMTCHHHAAVPDSGQLGWSDVPDLTNYRPNPDFLRTWLKDPAAVRPGTAMPNLDLKQDEIEALLAFLGTNKTDG